MQQDYSYEYLKEYRGITQDTFRFYDVKAKTQDGKPLALGFHYGNDAYKIRQYDHKGFHSVGPMNDASLFGMDRFGMGTAQAITITEGELDALSAYQMLGSKYPVVSVRSASSAKRDCQRAYEYLNSFSKIYICFDNDKPGEEATIQVASLFDVNKVHIVRLDRYKDANDYLTNGAIKEFVSTWWAAKKYLPKGVVSDYRTVEDILTKESNKSIASYPFPTIQQMTYGVQEKAVVLITAQEGVGKTELLRRIEYHLLTTTNEKMAIIHLEEEDKRSVQGLVGYHLSVPAHLPDSGVSVQDQMAAFRELTKEDGRLHIYTHFGSNDPDTILDIIRYLTAVCGCKFVALDHITMLVTGHEGDDERKKLDYISTRLAMLTRELDFTLFLVSHVNDDGKTRGSRNISKIADLWIDLYRDTDTGSTTTSLTIKKNRFTGKTGPAGVLVFDPATFRLEEVKRDEEPTFEPLSGLPITVEKAEAAPV